MHPVMHPEKNGKTGKMGGNGGERLKQGPETRRRACSNTTLHLQPSIYKWVQNILLQTAIVL